MMKSEWVQFSHGDNHLSGSTTRQVFSLYLGEVCCVGLRVLSTSP